MRALHAISTILFLLGAGFFVFDLACHLINFLYVFFGLPAPPLVEGLLTKISLESFWKAISKDNYEITKSMGENFIPPKLWDTIAHLPAPTGLIVISLVLYIPYKFLSLLGLGKKSA